MAAAAKILCVANQKGGVGKTTTTNALAMGLRHLDRRVLCIDFDPQGDLSFGLRADNRVEMQNSIYHALRGELQTVQTIQHTPFCDVIPCNMLLSGIELEFTGKGREYLLKKCLKPVLKKYDNILIDTPPALGILTVNAFTAADWVLMPVQPDIFSLQGLVQLCGTLDEVRRKSNPKVAAAGVVMTRFSARQNASRIIREAAEEITKQLNIPLLKTTIRNSSIITTAQIHRDDLMTYKRRRAVEDYRDLVDELLRRGVL